MAAQSCTAITLPSWHSWLQAKQEEEQQKAQEDAKRRQEATRKREEEAAQRRCFLIAMQSATNCLSLHLDCTCECQIWVPLASWF